MSIPTHYDAIQDLVPNAKVGVTTKGDKVIIHWLDERNQPNEEAIQAKLKELQAEYDAKQYQRDRAVAYPNIQDQLDMQYWDAVNGTTNWKNVIAKVKSDNPKP